MGRNAGSRHLTVRSDSCSNPNPCLRRVATHQGALRRARGSPINGSAEPRDGGGVDDFSSGWNGGQGDVAGGRLPPLPLLPLCIVDKMASPHGEARTRKKNAVVGRGPTKLMDLGRRLVFLPAPIPAGPGHVRQAKPGPEPFRNGHHLRRKGAALMFHPTIPRAGS